jgi:predicted deacylase
MRKRLALILLSCVLCVAATAQQPALTVGTATAFTGQTVAGFIEVSAGSDLGTNIPVAVIRGPKPGPTLALVAGGHGTEYASILALEKLIQELNPADISGTVIIVPLTDRCRASTRLRLSADPRRVTAARDAGESQACVADHGGTQPAGCAAAGVRGKVQQLRLTH